MTRKRIVQVITVIGMLLATVILSMFCRKKVCMDEAGVALFIDEFAISLYSPITEEGLVLIIREMEKTPWNGDNMETLRELQVWYPEMQEYKSYPVEEDKQAVPMIEIVEGTYTYILFSRNEKFYVMTCRTETTGDSVRMWKREVQDTEGYDIFEDFWWFKDENGLVAWVDEKTGTSYTERDIGNGCVFDFAVECDLDRGWQGELPVALFDVSIYQHGETEPFQIIEDVASADLNPFELEDFNVDGYLDIRMMYYYGANGGSASHYIWSPSQQKFLYGPTELKRFSLYSFDPETRKLFMHHHASAIAGTECTYQWYNEMEYALIKRYRHMDEGENYSDLRIEISKYEDGTEIVLSDYAYNMEEEQERIGYAQKLYWIDFTWSETIVDPEDGTKYVLHYVQVPEEEQTDKLKEFLYICREDTYLLNWFVEEGVPACELLSCKDIDGDGKKDFVVNYKDGTQKSILFSQFIEEKD